MSCTPTSVLVLPDPVIASAANVESVTSQAGPCTPEVVVSDDNVGDLVPVMLGIPTDPTSLLDLRVETTGGLAGATFAWKPTTGSSWRGMDDGRKFVRCWSPFNSDNFPNLDGGEAAAYDSYRRQIVCCAAVPGSNTIRLKIRDVTATYDDWTDSVIDLATIDHAPPLEAAEPFQRAALAVLADGSYLLLYAYVPRYGGGVALWATALLRSDDGGTTWTFLGKDHLTLISEVGHDLHLTASGSWVRIDAVVLGATRYIRSTGSPDGGITWTEPVQSDFAPYQGGTPDVDPSPYTVCGLGDGRFFAAYVSGTDDQWTTAAGFGGDKLVTTGGSAALVRRGAPGTIRGLGSCMAHGRVYVLASYEDGAGSNVDQAGLYYQELERVFWFGPGSVTPDLPESDQWQLVEPLVGWSGARFLPQRIDLVNLGGVLLAYGGLYDLVDDDDEPETFVAQLSHFATQTWGVVEPGGALTTSSDAYTLDQLYDVHWQAISGRPAGFPGAGGTSSPDTDWTEVQSGTPTLSWTCRTLVVDTTVGESLYWSVSRAASHFDSWALAGSTVGVIARIDSGSNQTADSHGVYVSSLTTTAGEELAAVIRMSTTGVTIRDIRSASNVGSVSIDLTGYCEIRLRFHDDSGTISSSVWAARLDDYFNPVQTTATLTAGAVGSPADELRFGCLGTSTAGNSRWREVWISKGVATDSPSFDQDTDLLGAPAGSEPVTLSNALSVTWGGASGVRGDSYQTAACYLYGVERIFVDSGLIGWRSTDIAAQTLIFRADDGTASTTQARTLHRAVALFGLEDRQVAIDYAASPSFASPTPGGTLDTTLFTGLSVVGPPRGSQILVTGSGRLPISGELFGHRLRFTTGAAAGSTFAIVRDAAGCLDLATMVDGQWVPADLSTAGVLDGDECLVFATFGLLDLGQLRRQRYMRLQFTDTDTATDDHRLAAMVAGPQVDLPTPLEWRHTDDEQADVQLFEGPNASHGFELGRPRRVYTGRMVADHQRWRESLRYLLRSLARYQVRPIVLQPDTEEPGQIIRGRFQPAPLENGFWWSQDDGSGLYRFPGGDQQIQIVEVP